ncbi:hypothetical protein TNCV_4933691 [Trichonephila clavipes]|nr:hypothetical protein TNCV_4933691 [Trichonephila clavipes]
MHHLSNLSAEIRRRPQGRLLNDIGDIQPDQPAIDTILRFPATLRRPVRRNHVWIIEPIEQGMPERDVAALLSPERRNTWYLSRRMGGLKLVSRVSEGVRKRGGREHRFSYSSSRIYQYYWRKPQLVFTIKYRSIVSLFSAEVAHHVHTHCLHAQIFEIEYKGAEVLMLTSSSQLLHRRSRLSITSYDAGIVRASITGRSFKVVITHRSRKICDSRVTYKIFNNATNISQNKQWYQLWYLTINTADAQDIYLCLRKETKES